MRFVMAFPFTCVMDIICAASSPLPVLPFTSPKVLLSHTFSPNSTYENN